MGVALSFLRCSKEDHGPVDLRSVAGAVAHEAAEASLELLYPTRCVGCELPGDLICEDCAAALPWVEQRLACPVCGCPYGSLTCTNCEGDWEMRATVCALTFADAAARMVTCLKDHHELRLAPVNAAAMLCALEEAAFWDASDGRSRYDPRELDACCFVPATAEAFARRGFDHMELTARAFSQASGIPLADVLVREKAADQRKLGRAGRARNLEGTIRVVDDVRGMRLLLLDDVVTTGASMREATRTLLTRGASSITACALARVW